MRHFGYSNVHWAQRLLLGTFPKLNLGSVGSVEQIDEDSMFLISLGELKDFSH